jgi:hypothetical protein
MTLSMLLGLAGLVCVRVVIALLIQLFTSGWTISGQNPGEPLKPRPGDRIEDTTRTDASRRLANPTVSADLSSRSLRGIRELKVIPDLGGSGASSLVLTSGTLQTEGYDALKKVGIKPVLESQPGMPYLSVRATVVSMGPRGYAFTVEIQLREPCVVSREGERDGLVVPICTTWWDGAVGSSPADGGASVLEAVRLKLASFDQEVLEARKTQTVKR